MPRTTRYPATPSPTRPAIPRTSPGAIASFSGIENSPSKNPADSSAQNPSQKVTPSNTTSRATSVTDTPSVVNIRNRAAPPPAKLALWLNTYPTNDASAVSRYRSRCPRNRSASRSYSVSAA